MLIYYRSLLLKWWDQDASRVILEADFTQLFRRTIESEVTNRPCRLTGLNTPRIAARSPNPLPKKEHRIARLARERRLEAVLCPASGSASGRVLHPVHWRHTRFLPKLSLSARPRWAINTHSEFMCSRESSDGANPFISVSAHLSVCVCMWAGPAIQLTPKPYYINASADSR